DLPEELREGAVVLGLALRCALQSGASLARAGFGGPPLAAANALFDAVLGSPSGLVFAVDEWGEVMGRIGTPDRKIRAELPDLLAELGKLFGDEDARDEAFPFVLSAGGGGSVTANTIIRDPTWRKKDAQGALRLNLDDAADLGVASGDAVRLTTRRASVVVAVEVSGTMQRGHVSLPNGLGLGYPTDGGFAATGVAP